VNDTFKEVATILADHERAKCSRDRRRENNGHHKNYNKSRESKWPLVFIGGKYDCAGEAQ
jgi:hypothetical protein